MHIHNMCIYTYIYTYIYIYIYTYIYTYINRSNGHRILWHSFVCLSSFLYFFVYYCLFVFVCGCLLTILSVNVPNWFLDSSAAHVAIVRKVSRGRRNPPSMGSTVQEWLGYVCATGNTSFKIKRDVFLLWEKKNILRRADRQIDTGT